MSASRTNFERLNKGAYRQAKIVGVEGDIPVGMKIKLGDFANAISTRLWETVGRVNWRTYDDARAFVHSLKLRSSGDGWRDFIKSGKKPPDISSHPEIVYANQGWTGWGDWLGTGRISVQQRKFRHFKAARAYARRLGLKTFAEWREYSTSGKRPDDIPGHPPSAYADSGWNGWGDWLGTGAVSVRLRRFRSFKKARAYVRGLGLKSQGEWREYCGSKKRPADIPTNPQRAYANDGWSGMADWLGAGRFRGTGWRQFNEARSFVRRLGLKSGTEWSEYCKSGEKPVDIPVMPYKVYAEDGWSSWGDWLGSGIIAPQSRQYRSFEKARAYVRGLGLKSQGEWREHCRSGKRPADIPANPDRVYAKSGWTSWGDWLGYAHHESSQMLPGVTEGQLLRVIHPEQIARLH